MQAVVIVSSSSSGSTAVAGYLERCGAHTCPPHATTNDPRTPISHEPAAYRDALVELIDEDTFKQVGDPEDFVAFFERWWRSESEKAVRKGASHVVLKHALQTFVLPYLKQRLNPKFILVTRPLGEIEATRKRRRWKHVHGRAGAATIHKAASDFFVENACPYIAVPFSTFRSDPAFRGKVLDFIDLVPSSAQLEDANLFLR